MVTETDIGSIIYDACRDGFGKIFGAAAKKTTDETVKVVGTSWKAATVVIGVVTGIAYLGYSYDYIRINFLKTAKQKSKEIVDETVKQNKESIKECKSILKRANVDWDTRAEVSGWKDITGTDKFDKIVDQVGKVMKLPEDHIILIKQAADTSSGYRKTHEFKCSLNDEAGGNIRLHTGSYHVSKSGDKYNLDIALAYMELSNIHMLPENVQTMILESGLQRTEENGNTMAQVQNADWKAFIEYESHKQLLNEFKP